jgi:hypothetical protein
MRLICVIFLLFFIITMPTTAAVISHGSAGSPVKVATVKPQATFQKIPQVTAIPSTGETTAQLSPILSVSSIPSGAVVSVNGAAKGKSPLTLGLNPGTYTVVISQSGFQDYTTTVILKDRSKIAIDARLQPVMVSSEVSTEQKYSVNRTSGVVTFDDGKRGSIPPTGGDNISDRYSTGSGSEGDLPTPISGSTTSSSLSGGVEERTQSKVQLASVGGSFTTTPTTISGLTIKPLGKQRQAGVFESFFGIFSFLSQHSCLADETVCNGKCVNLMEDPHYCGSCDYVCDDTAVCLQGQCVEPVNYTDERTWPAKYKAPDLIADGNDVAIESFEIVHENFTRVK